MTTRDASIQFCIQSKRWRKWSKQGIFRFVLVLFCKVFVFFLILSVYRWLRFQGLVPPYPPFQKKKTAVGWLLVLQTPIGALPPCNKPEAYQMVASEVEWIYLICLTDIQTSISEWIRERKFGNNMRAMLTVSHPIHEWIIVRADASPPRRNTCYKWIYGALTNQEPRSGTLHKSDQRFTILPCIVTRPSGQASHPSVSRSGPLVLLPHAPHLNTVLPSKTGLHFINTAS